MTTDSATRAAGFVGDIVRRGCRRNVGFWAVWELICDGGFLLLNEGTGDAWNRYYVSPEMERLAELAAMKKSVDDGDESPATGKRKRPGRPKADAETEHNEARLKAEWRQAHEAGIRKPEFAADHGMTLSEFDGLLDRVRKRKPNA